MVRFNSEKPTALGSPLDKPRKASGLSNDWCGGLVYKAIKITAKIGLLFLYLGLSAADDTLGQMAPEFEKSITGYYKQRFALKNIDQKLVDNQGNGFEPLYGVRNFRKIFDGIAYRGGANNFYHRTHQRENENPLPLDGLFNLCKEGFKQAIYLYPKNFDEAPKDVSCVSPWSENHRLQYRQKNPKNVRQMREILEVLHGSIVGENQRPVYLHCWNGWHASGLASAISFRQFCGWSGEKAVDYWVRNAHQGNHETYASIRNVIRDFQSYEDLNLSDQHQTEFCP